MIFVTSDAIISGLYWSPERHLPAPVLLPDASSKRPRRYTVETTHYRYRYLRSGQLVCPCGCRQSGGLRFAGITFPARLRFTHNASQGYRHYIEATVFGCPLLKVKERYLDGHVRMELPMGVIENEPKVNMAANLGLWGESVWLPTIFVTDPRVRWEAIDETTARLVVPFDAEEDTFTVSFDEVLLTFP